MVEDLAEDADEETSHCCDTDGDAQTGQLHSTLSPSGSAGRHLHPAVSVARTIGRGGEEDSRVEGSDEGGHQEDEDGAEGVDDAFAVEVALLAVEESGEDTDQEADELGGEGVREDVGAGSVGDGALSR